MVPLGAGNARAANDWTMFILDRQRAAHSATSLRNRQRTSLAGEWIAGDSTIAAAAGGIAVSAFVYRCLAENGEWEVLLLLLLLLCGRAGSDQLVLCCRCMEPVR